MKSLYLLIGVIALSLSADLQAGNNCQQVGSKGKVTGAWCKGAIIAVAQANQQCGCKIAVSQQPDDQTVKRLNAVSAREQQNQKNNAALSGPAKAPASGGIGKCTDIKKGILSHQGKYHCSFFVTDSFTHNKAELVLGMNSIPKSGANYHHEGKNKIISDVQCCSFK